jgi:hypothetical protein
MSEDDFIKALTEKGFKFGDYKLLIELGYLEFNATKYGIYKVLKDFKIKDISLTTDMVISHNSMETLIMQEMASKDKYTHKP